MKAIALLLAFVVVAEAAPQQPLKIQRPNGIFEVPNFRPGPPIPTSNAGVPVLQALTVKGPNGEETRRLALYVPRDRNGNRYFYTRTSGGQHGSVFEEETTTETWLDSAGLPLRTRYQFVTPSRTYEVDTKFRPAQTKVELVADFIETKTGKKPVRRQFVRPFNTRVGWQFRSYYPADIAADLDGRGYYMSIDPVSQWADSTWFERLPSSKPGVRYRIRRMSGWDDFDLDEQGRIRRWTNSEGLTAALTEPIAGEMEALEKVLAAATGIPAKSTAKESE